MRFVYLFVFTPILSALAYGQGQSFHGELVSATARDFGQFSAEIYPVTGGNSRGNGVLDKTFVSPDGRFEFRNISPGQYLVVIKDRFGEVVCQQYGQSTAGVGVLSLRLPESKHEQPVSGVVSIQELQHHPPKAASKAFRESLKKAGKGDSAASMALLERAVELDPHFVAALNNLGVRYIRAGRYADAAAAFRRALEVSSRDPMLHANLAQALLFLKQYSAAEATARAGLSIDPTDPNTSRVQLALGLALAAQGAHKGARDVLVTCTHSTDEVVRRQAEGVLAQLK